MGLQQVGGRLHALRCHEGAYSRTRLDAHKLCRVPEPQKNNQQQQTAGEVASQHGRHTSGSVTPFFQGYNHVSGPEHPHIQSQTDLRGVDVSFTASNSALLVLLCWPLLVATAASAVVLVSSGCLASEWPCCCWCCFAALRTGAAASLGNRPDSSVDKQQSQCAVVRHVESRRPPSSSLFPPSNLITCCVQPELPLQHLL